MRAEPRAWLARRKPNAPWRNRGRGAAAVETAIMVPILFFLTFGIMEFGLYWQAQHTFNDGARAGARLGATLARELDYEDDIVATVEEIIRGSVVTGEINRLSIFKADPATGEPYTGTVLNCSTDCYRYNWDANTESFVPVAGPEWAPSDQAACGVPGHNDYLGIYVEGTFKSLTGILPSDRTISESSIIRLEPVPLSNTCEPSS